MLSRTNKRRFPEEEPESSTAGRCTLRGYACYMLGAAGSRVHESPLLCICHTFRIVVVLVLTRAGVTSTYLSLSRSNSPNSEGLLNRQPPTAALRQDGAYIDREQVVPYRQKHQQRQKCKPCETQACPPEIRQRESQRALAQQSFAVVERLGPSRGRFLTRFHSNARVGVGRRQGLGLWSQHHDHRVVRDEI